MFIAQACHANFVFAHALDSLICVSRQDEWHHTVTMHYFHVHMQRHSPTRQQFTKPLLLHWCTDLTRIHRARHSVRTPTQDSQPNLHRLVQASTPAHSNLPQKAEGSPHFLFSNFEHYYHSAQSPVSHFPHGTCSLLALDPYSSLHEIYHPLHTPIPRGITHGQCTMH